MSSLCYIMLIITAMNQCLLEQICWREVHTQALGMAVSVSLSVGPPVWWTGLSTGWIAMKFDIDIHGA